MFPKEYALTIIRSRRTIVDNTDLNLALYWVKHVYAQDAHTPEELIAQYDKYVDDYWERMAAKSG